jgi:hypothetical protein
MLHRLITIGASGTVSRDAEIIRAQSAQANQIALLMIVFTITCAVQ